MLLNFRKFGSYKKLKKLSARERAQELKPILSFMK